MAKKVINAFNAGEVSPYLYARNDNELYDSACLKMENFLPLEYGGATKRPSTEFIHEFKDTLSSPIGETKLYPFILNSKDTYILCFTNYLLTIFKDNELIASTPSLYPDDHLGDLKFIQSNDVLFIASGEYPLYQLTRLDNDEFIFSEFEFKYPPEGKEVENVSIQSDVHTGRATLTASSLYFQQTQVGSLLILKQKRDLFNSSINETLNGGVTNAMNVSFSNYEITSNPDSTENELGGKLVVEKSTDGGTTFEEEFVLEDRVNDSTSSKSGTTFSSLEKENANTFIRVRHYPDILGGVTANVTIKSLDPYVCGLFKIESVGSSTTEEASTTATGIWLSPIQDTKHDYNIEDPWSQGQGYNRGDKVYFSGQLTFDPDFGGTGNAYQDNNATDANKIIDITFDYVNNDIYCLTYDNKILKFDYDETTKAITYKTTRTITYSDRYVGDQTGRNTFANQSHYGIAFLDTPSRSQKLYLLLREDQNGGSTTGNRDRAHEARQRINFINVFSDTDVTPISTADTLFTETARSSAATYNMHGLGTGAGRFYWKTHHKYKTNKNHQRIERFSVDYNGNNVIRNFVAEEYGKSAKQTSNGKFYTDDFRLMAEPDTITDSDIETFQRNQMDTIYMNGYLLCLNDVDNGIDFRTTNFGDTGITFTGDGTNSFLEESYWGMAAAIRTKTVGNSGQELVIGNIYEVVSLDTNTAQSQANLQQVGAKPNIAVGETFIATHKGLEDVTFTNNVVTTVKLHKSDIDKAQDVDLDIFTASRQSTSDNAIIGVRFRRLSSEGNPTFYQATKDIPSSNDGDSFKTQYNQGLWAERYPEMETIIEGAFSDKNGHVKAVSIFENRLVLAGNTSFPNTLWFSKIDDLNNFNLGVNDTSALRLKFNSLSQDQIEWLCATRELIIGTRDNEWSLGSGSQNLPITPTQLNLKRRSQYGSSKVQALLVNSAVLFFMRQGTKLREWYLQENQEDYLAQDLAFIAEHITGDGVIQMAVQTQPRTIIWMVRNDGVLIGLTYERETNTFAWHRHTFNGTVESVAVVPQIDREDKVFLTIKNPNDAITGLNVGKFNITIASAREDQDSNSNTFGQEIEITPDATKHVTPRILHGSGEASAIVLPVNQTNGTSGSISNITPDVYGFKGRLKTYNLDDNKIHFVPETFTVINGANNSSEVNGIYTLTEDKFNQPAWASATHTIQVNQELAIDPSTGFSYNGAAQGSTHGTKWQIIRTEGSVAICEHAYSSNAFPAVGTGSTNWSHLTGGSGDIQLQGDGYPFTADHLGLPLVYLNNTVSPNRTPDIGGLVHGQTYFLRSREDSSGDQTPNRIFTLKDSGGSIIDITNNTSALKTATGGVFNLKNHFLASAVFATPRINTFATGLSTSSNDTLYNTGSPSTNTNFSKTMTFADGDICGVEILLWNEYGNKEANDAFIEYEGDPTINIDKTVDNGKQTKVTFTYDEIGEYKIDVFIEDTGTGKVTTIRTGEGVQPRILGDRYVVRFDPQKHESAYNTKYSGLDLYVRNRNFNSNTINYLSLDGVNDYVDAPHVNFQNDETIDFTLNFKLRQRSDEREWLVNQGGSFEIDIRANATNEFYLILGRGTDGTSITYNKILQFNNDFTDNQWHTLNITVDPTSTTNNITATIDGVSTTSTPNLSFDFSGTTFQHANQANYNFLIGNARAYTSPYNGDEPLYPDTIPNDTLDLDLRELILKLGNVTQFSYNFNETSGTTVNDTSGSNNASIINNTSPNWQSEPNKFTGLDHLENKTVTYKVNGGTAQTATVVNGAINVGSQTNANVVVGLPYTSTLAPLYVDANGSMGSKKSVNHATIRFKDTLEAKAGQTETDLDLVKFGSTTTLNNEDTEVWLSNANEFLQTVYVVSDTPQPCTVLAMVVDVEGV